MVLKRREEGKEGGDRTEKRKEGKEERKVRCSANKVVMLWNFLQMFLHPLNPQVVTSLWNRFCSVQKCRPGSLVLAFDTTTVFSFTTQFDHVAKFVASGTFFLIVLFCPRLYLVLYWMILGFNYLACYF